MALGKPGKKNRKTRTRRELFENLLIVTDGEKTETNYFQGLRDSFPDELKKKSAYASLIKLTRKSL